ncbi:tankyrase [Canna indica]|uniref:Tankyrase n=1 Tax=Canna indica TaxID=4628 RepID=A0AAQ3QE29_9LILI|nr:tankyrase [Canna indica]
MAVPGRRNGAMGDDDDDDEILYDDGDVLAELDLEPEVPPHLRALVEAAETGNLNALRAALDNHNGSIDEPVEDGDTVLHLSCLYGHFPCVQLILERGASLESKDEEGAIPLHDACAGGFTEIVQYMLNFAGSRDMVTRMLSATDTEGDTPLHHAARGEHLDVVRLLLAAGASPNKTNMYGKIPAELADQDTEVRSILTAATAGDAAVAM